MEGIRDFEKNILTEINFVDRYLDIELQFVRNNSDTILKCDNKTFLTLVDSKYNMKHQGGGYYRLSKVYENYELVLQIHKTSTCFLLFYIYIYIDDKLQNVDLSPVGSAMYYLPYDAVKAEKVSRTFGINNLNEMKDYLNQMIGLWEEFTDLYIEKLKLGIEPPNTPYEDD